MRAVGVGLALACLAAGCGGGGSDDGAGKAGGAPDVRDLRPQNVVLVTVDTLRADALGFAGNEDARTPALDRLAAAGRVYPNAHAHNVVTLPSHANILTGRYPYQHGVRNNGGFELREDVPTLASLLRAEGFATAAVIGAFPLDSRFGLDRGFQVYDDELPAGPHRGVFTYNERPGGEVVARGRRWWQEHQGERRFLWLHLFEPHAPYEPPEPYASSARTPYLGEVAAVDSYLAPWLQLFVEGREEPTLVVVTADHGEALGEHGELTHGLFAYEPTLAVPLVLWGAGVPAGVDRRPAGHVDLLPTILGLLGVAVPPGLPGRSLVAPPEPGERSFYFESLSPNLDYGWAPLRGVLRGGMKFIDLPEPELYDLEQDPGESENLVTSRRAEARSLARELPSESDWPPEAGAVDAEAAARLRALGYLGGGAPRRAAYGPEDDPKNLVDLDRKLNSVASLYLAGRADDAIAAAKEIVARRPTMTAAYEYLVKILLERRQLGEALAVVRQAESAGAANDALRQQLGLTLVEAGRPSEALEVLRRVDPELVDPATLNAAGLALASLGRFAEAKEALDRAYRAKPEDPTALESLAYLAVHAGRFEDAREYARRALDLDAARPAAWNNLGVAEYELGHPREAVQAWTRASELEPGNLDVLYNLGVVAARSDQAAAARRALGRFLQLAPEGPYAQERETARSLLAGLQGGAPGR